MNAHAGSVVEQRLVRRVFSWMFAGLLMTAIISLALYTNPNVPYYFLSHKGAFWVLVIAQLVTVFYLSARIHRMSVFGATFAFFLYAALNGISFTVVLAIVGVYTVTSAFLIASGMFGICALIGFTTRSNLSRIGTFALMFALGVVLASILNIFILHSDTLDLIFSYLLVGLFCFITAYDLQKIKELSWHATDEESAAKLAIYGALMLYLDFIIILRNLIRILSRD
jgi:FtsH-binding integral membrane protein